MLCVCVLVLFVLVFEVFCVLVCSVCRCLCFVGDCVIDFVTVGVTVCEGVLVYVGD